MEIKVQYITYVKYKGDTEYTPSYPMDEDVSAKYFEEIAIKRDRVVSSYVERQIIIKERVH